MEYAQADNKRADAKIHRRISLAEKLNSNYEAPEKKSMKESNTDRLRYIVEEPGLRSLFREFLRGNFCEENLSFWMDVQDFKKKQGLILRQMHQHTLQQHHVFPGLVFPDPYYLPCSPDSIELPAATLEAIAYMQIFVRPD